MAPGQAAAGQKKIIGSKVSICVTGQGISSNWKIPFEILPEKRQITSVLGVLLFTEEFQMEPLAPNDISDDTRPTAKYVLVQY